MDQNPLFPQALPAIPARNVPALPYLVVGSGGEDRVIPSDTSSDARTRSTPERPPGLRQVNIAQSFIHEDSTNVDLLMLNSQHQQQQNLFQQQNNFVQLNVESSEAVEVARLQQQALLVGAHATSEVRMAHSELGAARERELLTNMSAQHQVSEAQNVAVAAQQFAQNTAQLAQQRVEAEIESLNSKAAQFAEETRQRARLELEEQRQAIFMQAQAAVEEARKQAAEAQAKAQRLEEQLEQLRNMSSQSPTKHEQGFSTPVGALRQPVFQSPTKFMPEVPMFPTSNVGQSSSSFVAQPQVPPPPLASNEIILQLVDAVNQLQMQFTAFKNSGTPPRMHFIGSDPGHSSRQSKNSRKSKRSKEDDNPPPSDSSSSSSSSSSKPKSSPPQSRQSNSPPPSSSPSSSDREHREKKDERKEKGRDNKTPPPRCDKCGGPHVTTSCPGTEFLAPGESEEDIVRVRHLDLLKVSRMPTDAGDFRQWKNTLSMQISSLDRTAREVLVDWLAPSFESEPNEKASKKLQHSQGFVRLDKQLALALTEEKHLKGSIGVKIQSYLEQCQKQHVGAKGRVIVHMIASEFHLDRQRGAALSQMHLLNIQLDGFKLSDLVKFTERVDYCLNSLTKEERPAPSTMFQWLFEKLKGCSRMAKTIDKIKDSKLSSSKRSFEYLYSKLKNTIRESREDDNNAAVAAGLNAGPLGKTGKVGGAPANATDQRPKRPKSRKRDKDKTTDASNAVTTSSDQTQNVGGAAAKAKSKGKGKGRSKSSGPNSSNNANSLHPTGNEHANSSNQGNQTPKSPITDADRAKIPCRYFQSGTCKLGKDCKFAHIQKDKPKDKIPASAALLLAMGSLGTADATSRIPALPACLRDVYRVEFMGDTGAGRHLGSLPGFTAQGVPEHIITSAMRKTNFPVEFDTGGGEQQGTNTVSMESPGTGSKALVYMLKQCPLAMSIGQIVLGAKMPFIWMPDELPFFVKSVKACKLFCAKRNRIHASRVHENVPMFSLDVQFSPGMPAPVVSPQTPVAEAPVEGPAVAEEAVEAPILESLPSEQLEDDGIPLCEIALNSKEEATSLEHLATHFPKNQHCEWCNRANLQAAPARRVKPTEVAEVIATEPMSHILGDHMVMGPRSEGKDGERNCLLLIDAHTGVERAYPVQTKHHNHVRESLQHFHADKHNSTKTFFKSDGAKELILAARELGFTPDPSLPQRKVHNARCENRINTVKRGTRAALLQSGLPHKLWPECVQYITDARSFTLPALSEPSKTRHHALTGESFKGKLIPFGALVYYRPYGANKSQLPMEAWSKPGIMLGYNMRPGLKWSGGYRVLDYSRLQKRDSNALNVLVVPEIKLPVDDQKDPKYIFPMATARDLAVENFKDAEFEKLEFPSYEDAIMSLEDEEDAVLHELIEAPSDAVTVWKPRATAVTLERRVRFGRTPNCPGCHLGKRLHTDECHLRFENLLAEEQKQQREAKEAKAAKRTAKASTSAKAEEVPMSSSSSSSSNPRVAGLIAAADTLFCSSCLDRTQNCACAELCSRTEVAKTPKPRKSVRFADPPVCGENAIERICDEATFKGLPALVATAVAQVTNNKQKHDTCLFEYCCSENSMLSQVAGEYNIDFVRLHRGFFNCDNDFDIELLLEQISHVEVPVLWISIPCTEWTAWQHVCEAKYGPAYRKALAIRRRWARRRLRKALAVAAHTIKCGGKVGFEWPRGASGWQLPELVQFIREHNMAMADFDGCAVGLVNKDNEPHLKMWRVIANDVRVANSLNNCRCTHPSGFKHAEIAGGATANTAFYPRPLCETIISAMFPQQTSTHIPAMPCQAVTPQQEHRPKDDVSNSIFAASLRALEVHVNPRQKVPAMVTRLLDRKEMLANPKAVAAVRKEANGLAAGGTWLPETVQEVNQLKQHARATGEKVVIGQAMTICSEKYAELEDESLHELKGRIVFRGDNARDEDGALAVYQDLAASPTLITSANANIAYGLFRGHKTTSADAVKAYIQSDLKSKHPTFVELPKELWPEEWHGKYTRPAVKLQKSLYGHPESGAHWQNHLEIILKIKMGAEVMEGHQSTYFFPSTRLLLTAYVDDFLLSGPADAHDLFWSQLSEHVKLEEISGLGRFLGRYHEIQTIDNKKVFVFSMPDYVKSACELYESMPGSRKLKPAPTPFVNEGSLCAADDQERGELSDNACRVLMKCLWVARLARPDLLKPITALARFVQSWSRNCDKQLYRLMCYMSSTPDLKLVGRVNDALSDVHLRLYVDADFCGSREDTKSTSGGYLVLVGPDTFFPLSWVSKKQTATSKSTAESELVSLSLSLFDEGLPMLSLWQKLTDKQIDLVIKEDNEATIKIAKKGFSPKLRSLARTHRVSLGAIHDAVTQDDVKLEHISTNEQAADIFTKALEPQKWHNALQLLGLQLFKTPDTTMK